MQRLLFNPRGALRSGWKALGFGLLAFLAMELLDWMAAALPGAEGLLGRWGVWIDAAAGVLASILCLRLEGRHPLDFGLRFNRRWVLEFLAGVGGGMVLLGAMALAVRATGAFRWERNPSVDAGQLLLWAWFYLGVAFNEEILFRGYAFQRLTEGSLGVWGTQLLLALFFAMDHWANPNNIGSYRWWTTLNIALAALLLGFALLRTGSLALPIGLHLGWNWMQGSLLGFPVSGFRGPGWWRPVLDPSRASWVHGGLFGLEATLACAVLCGLAVIVFARWKGRAGT